MCRWVVACVLVLVGCRSGASKDAGAPPEVVVGDRSFTTDEIELLVNRQPELVRARYRTEPGRHEFIDQLVESELLLQEARRRGLEKDPDVQSLVDRLLIQKLAEQTVPPAPSEEELRAAYDAARSEFVKPDRLHVRAVFFSSMRGSSTRAKIKQEAEALAARLQSLKQADRETKFEALARERSDDPSKEAGGDLGPRTPEDLAAVLGDGVQSSLASLTQAGQVSGAIETERGVAILFLRGVQPGLTQTFESVRPRLEQRIVAERRGRVLQELVTKLKSSTPITRK